MRHIALHMEVHTRAVIVAFVSSLTFLGSGVAEAAAAC
jgi:hypothetical protein